MLVALIAVGLSALGGFGGLSVAAMLCPVPDAVRRRVLPALVSSAVGALLGVAPLDLVPEASVVLGARRALATALAGIVTGASRSWHCGVMARRLWAEHRQTAQLVLIGDSAHNFMDGALIGAAALVSFRWRCPRPSRCWRTKSLTSSVISRSFSTRVTRARARWCGTPCPKVQD